MYGKDRDQLLCELDRVASRKALLERDTDEWKRLQNLQVRILGELHQLERQAAAAEAVTDLAARRLMAVLRPTAG